MASNKLFADERIVDAAVALATMVKHHSKPLVFDLTLYMEIVAGLTVGIPNSKLEAWLCNPGDPTLSEEQKSELRNEIKRVTKAERCNHEDRKLFTEALSDAFTLNEVCDIQPCLLVEVGYGSGGYEPLSDTALVYMVIPQPKVENCFIIDL